MGEFMAYMGRLAASKRENPGTDAISDILAMQAEDSSFTDRDVMKMASVLTFAGHETTAARIGFGTLWLLAETSRRDRLAAAPETRILSTVEEILRIAAPGGIGMLRYAQEDVEIGGVTIVRGDAVLLANDAANRVPPPSPTRTSSPRSPSPTPTSPSATAPTSALAPTSPAPNCGSSSRHYCADSPTCAWPSTSKRSTPPTSGSPAESDASPSPGEPDRPSPHTPIKDTNRA